MKKYRYNPTTGRTEPQPRRRSSGELLQRAARKTERAALAAQGLLPRQQPTFHCFLDRADRAQAIFESPNSQQDLNVFMCMHWIETPAEHSRNRLSVAAENMELWASELIAAGWLRA